MNLFHGLQQKLNNFRMQVAANQNFGRSADKLHICGRDIVVDIDHTLRQNEAIDRNDAVGIARIMQCGWYKEVRVKDLDSHAIKALLVSGSGGKKNRGSGQPGQSERR
jgi:hypothetical protein